MPQKDGPLYDAARMLRKAGDLVRDAANLDAVASIENAERTARRKRQAIRDARTLMDAAGARMAGYEL